MLLAVLLNLPLNKTYIRKTRERGGALLAPESRLVLCCAGGIALPGGLLVFAFTADREVHWMPSLVGGTLFGFGFVGIFLSMTVCSFPPRFRFIANRTVGRRTSWIRTRCTRRPL